LGKKIDDCLDDASKLEELKDFGNEESFLEDYD